MTDHRTDRVHLSNDRARCEPANECSQRSTCARYLAPVARFSTMMGHDMPMMGFRCYYYISVDSLRAAAPAARRRILDAPDGLPA